MKVKVFCFAAIEEITGLSELEITGCQSISELKAALNSKYPKLLTLNYAISVNQKVTHIDKTLHASDEIALLPPFSGG